MSQENTARSETLCLSTLIVKIIGLIVIVSLLTTTTFAAAPQATQTFVVQLSELRQDIAHLLAANNIGANAFSLSTILNWLSKPKGTKRQAADRIIIRPTDESGSLTMMQGERVVFNATGYSGNTAIGGVAFKWTAQDAAQKTPIRNLVAGVFEAKRPGTYVVTATSEDGLQASVTVNVNFDEGYGVRHLFQKKESDRTSADRRGIAAMQTKGILVSRDISSKARYDAEAERLTYETDKLKRSSIHEIQLQRQRQYPDSQKGWSVSSLTSNPDDSISIAKNFKKPRRGGPSADENDPASDESAANSPVKVSPPSRAHSTFSAARRPIDDDGWTGSNWSTADDPINQTGTPALTAPAAGASNGDYQINAPVLSLKGRGIDVDLALVYNSRLWSKSGTVMSYDSDRGFPAPGWNIGFGKMIYMGANGGCMLVSPDGTRRSYAGTNSSGSYGSYYWTSHSDHTTDGSFIDYGCYYSSSTYGQSLSGTATLSNGTTITYTSPTSVYDQLFPTQITDAQGNYINITYVNNQGPNIDTVTDTLGRTITFNYETGTGRLISITGPGYNNTTRTFVRLHYTAFTLSYAFATGYATDVPGSNTQYLLDSIYYPDTNTGYWFGDSDSYSSYGMIAKSILQRGMTYTPPTDPPGTVTQGTIGQGTMTKQCVYDFPMTAVSTLTDAPEYTTTSESWANMDPTSPVQTHYAVSSTSTDQTIAVTLPDGTYNKQTSHIDPGNLLDGVYYQAEIYASSSAPTALSKTKTFFGTGDSGTSRPTRIEVTDELGQMTATDLLYAASSHNQLITEKEYGYGGTALYRQTNNTYDSYSGYTSRHIFNLLKSTEIVDASGNRLTRTEYQYDNNAEVNGTGSPVLDHADGVVMHNNTSDPYTTDTQQVDGEDCMLWYPETSTDPACSYEDEEVWVFIAGGYYDNCHCEEYEQVTVSVYDPNSIFRGNVTKTTVYANAAGTPSGSIDYDFTYDITGNQRTATTNCCQQMSFDYTDSFTDSTNHHAYAFPTVHTKGSSDTNSSLRMSESAVYDFNTGLMTSSTDFNGRSTAYTYDAAWRRTQTTASTGAKTTIDYDDANLSSTQTGKLSDNTTIISEATTLINGQGQTVLSKYLAGATNWNATSIKYDEMGRKLKVSLPYDSAGSPSQWTQYAYDHLSRVTQVTAPDGSTSINAYNETTRPDSASSTAGQTVRSQDAWGRERWARTDDFGRLVEVVEPNPATTGNSINVASAADGAVASASSTQSGYPASAAINGDRNGTNWTSGGGWIDGTANSYPDWLEVDFAGSKTISEIDAFTVQDNYTNPVNPTEAMTFSVWGITAFDVQYWDGSAWVTVPGGSVTGNNKVWRKFTFTAVTTDKIRVLTSGALNSQSRITELEAWTSTSPSITGSVFDSGSLKTSYAYDPVDELTNVTQGGQTRAFKYDSLGRLTLQKLAEQTATIKDDGTYVGAGGTGAAWSDYFEYDSRSNIKKRIDARGVETDFSYSIGTNTDPLNRLQGISYNTSGADNTTYGTIPPAQPVTISYMTTGDQTRVAGVTTTGVATETNSYDTEGRVSDYTLTFANRTSYPMVTSYSYDTASRLTEIRYPAAYGMTGSPRKTIDPSYDQTSRLTQLNVDSSTQLNEIAYNTFGQVTSLKSGAGTTNPDVEQYSYDGQTGLLTNQKVIDTNTSATLLDLSYHYDRGNSIGSLSGKTGQLTRITNNLDHNKDRSFEYDALGRLTAAKGGLATGATGVTANWSQSYAYDRYGNRTGVTASGITADSNNVPSDGIPSLSYDSATNRITPNGPTGWQYDAAGNLIRGQNQSGTWLNFEYDAAGRLVKVKDDSTPNNVLETYTYGADRRHLINESSGGRTYYAWGGSSVIQEYTEATLSTTPVYSKSYIYSGSSLLSTATNVSGSEVVEYHHPDRLGTKIVTNPSGGTYFEQSTLPFGTELTAENYGTSSTNQKFTSYDRSSLTGLDHAANRTFSPGQSRFTQVDPMGVGASGKGDPQSLNLYSYVQNNPVDFVDPSGLLCTVFVDGMRWFDLPEWMAGDFPSGDGVTVECDQGGPRNSGDEGGGGGGAGGSGQTSPIQQIKKDFYQKYGKIYNECLKEVMKKDTPNEQTLDNSPVAIGQALGIRSGTIVAPSKNYDGAVVLNSLLIENYGLPYKLMRPSPDNPYPGAITDEETLFTYGHESANLLDAKKNPKGKMVNGKRELGRTYGDPNNDDPDTGRQVEDCMKAKIKSAAATTPAN